MKMVAMLLLLVMVGVGNVQAETIYHETFGTPTDKTNVTSFSGWSATDITYGGDAKVGVTSYNQCSLTGSSKSGYVYMSSASIKQLDISGINTSGYSTIKLSYNYKGNSNSAKYKIEYSTDGSTYTALSSNNSCKTTWQSKTESTELPATSNLRLRITNTATNYTTYFDDLEIIGTKSTPKESFDILWKVNGTNYTTGNPTASVESGSKVSLLPTNPTVPSDCSGKVFVGWTESEELDGSKPSDLFINADQAPTVTAAATYYAVFATESAGGGSTTEKYGWEDADATTNWEFTGVSAGTAYTKTGTKAGEINPSSASHIYVKYKNKVKVTSFSFEFLRKTTNNNYNVYIETSSDGTSWTAVETYAMSTFSTKETWYNKSHTFDGETDLYVRFHCYTSNTMRYVDDISITYAGGTSYSDYSTTCTPSCTSLGQINGSVILTQMKMQLKI